LVCKTEKGTGDFSEKNMGQSKKKGKTWSQAEREGVGKVVRAKRGAIGEKSPQGCTVPSSGPRS